MILQFSKSRKENIRMKSYDYEAVAYDADVYCVDCLPEEMDVESDEVSPIFADSEWDDIPVCCVCGEVHEYVGLTEIGQIELEKAKQRLNKLQVQGFDRAYLAGFHVKVGCSQCEAFAINGLATHERGCPNIVTESDDEDE